MDESNSISYLFTSQKTFMNLYLKLVLINSHHKARGDADLCVNRKAIFKQKHVCVCNSQYADCFFIYKT